MGDDYDTDEYDDLTDEPDDSEIDPFAVDDDLESSSDNEDSPGGDVFQQCAGSQVDTKKCKRGCLCIKKSDYYSGCKPPPGSQFCDVEAAKGFVKRADNVYNRKKAIENHKKQISDSKWDVLQTKKKKTKDLEDALETAEEEKAAAKKEANLEM